MEVYWNAFCEIAIARIVKDKGGFREKDIYSRAHDCIICVWSEEHKVVDVISKSEDYDGHRDSFSVDLVTGRICG